MILVRPQLLPQLSPIVVQSDSELYKVIDSFTTLEQIVEVADSER